MELYIDSSAAAVNRLIHGYSDIARTTLKLSDLHKKRGYVETTFCKGPLAVIVNAQCPVTDITEEQLQRIFSRNISNWKQLGGHDQPILLIVPGKNTAAYANFERQVMSQREIAYDLMTYISTQVIEAVKQFPWSISFITQGAIANQADVKSLRINGLSTKDKDYPYYQELSFVTQGSPVGTAKTFVDFAFSKKEIEAIKKKGMIPIVP